MVNYAQLIIEEALRNELTNLRRLYSKAVASKNNDQAETFMVKINKIKTKLKEDFTMTREDKLYSMRGVDLIHLADKLGVKVACNKARTQLKEGKDKVVERIIAFEASQNEAEEVTEEAEEETAVEAQISPSEEVSEELKQNNKKEPKKPNKKLTELTYKGKTKSIREWAAELEMPWPTLYDRVNRNGWSVEDAIETPLGQRRAR